MLEDEIVKAERIANLLAIQKATQEYGIHHIFSFHSSVDSAASFVRHNEGIQVLLPYFKSLHVSGAMSMSKRDTKLKDFEQADNAIISNARCLTEGVDVPVVDMVAFMSPKESKVDIVQAAGRAMRKPNDPTILKECGYILLPLLIEQNEGETLEQALDKTNFDTTWDVLNALQENDEVLADIINQMREDKGRGLGYNDLRLREKIEVLGPKLELNDLRNSITIKIIDRLGSNWDERFGELVKYKEQHGNCDVPQKYLKNPTLGIWVSSQRSRYAANTIPKKQIDKLNELGFNWKTRDVHKKPWHEMFEELLKYKEMHDGDCNVPQNYPENSTLGTWASRQRSLHKKGKLAAELFEQLDDIGFNWTPLDSLDQYWEKMFAELITFKKLHGHCNVPNKYKLNQSLGTWVDTQRSRHKKKQISLEQIDKLNSIGFNWNPLDELNKSWQQMFAELIKYKEVNKNCNVPRSYLINPQLATWVNTQRVRYKNGQIPQVQIDQLNSIGFMWKIRK